MTSGVFRQGRKQIHVEALGSPGGRPVVLVHGLSGSGRWWRRNVPALEGHWRVYLVDLAGYGRARRQRVPSLREAAGLISAWIEEENLSEVALVGHSMGGHICLHVAALQPTRVTRLVLVGASGLLRAPFYRSAVQLPRAALVGSKRFLPQVMADALRAGPVNLLRSAVDLLRDDVRDVLPRIRARTLVVWGARDPLVPLSLGRALSRLVPGAQLSILPRAGHVAMVDAPAEFNAALLAFLNHPGTDTGPSGAA